MWKELPVTVKAAIISGTFAIMGALIAAIIGIIPSCSKSSDVTVNSAPSITLNNNIMMPTSESPTHTPPPSTPHSIVGDNKAAEPPADLPPPITRITPPRKTPDPPPETNSVPAIVTTIHVEAEHARIFCNDMELNPVGPGYFTALCTGITTRLFITAPKKFPLSIDLSPCHAGATTNVCLQDACELSFVDFDYSPNADIQWFDYGLDNKPNGGKVLHMGKPGAWASRSVDIPETAVYSISWHGLNTGANDILAVEVDDQEVGRMALETPRKYMVWKKWGALHLTQGKHLIRFRLLDGASIYLDRFKLEFE